jgi:chorismate mutase
MALAPEKRKFAVIENNKVINIIVGVEDEVVAANPDKYIEYTNGWDYENGIDLNNFIQPKIEVTEVTTDLVE